jgi:hypothetical protein
MNSEKGFSVTIFAILKKDSTYSFRWFRRAMLSSLTTEIATFGGQITQEICQSTTESDCVQILSMFLHRSKFFRTK